MFDMEDACTLTHMALTTANNNLALNNLIDELDTSDSYWLQETAEEYGIFQPAMSSLFSLNISSNCSGYKMEDSPHDILLYPEKEEISNSQSDDGDVIQAAALAENFMADDYDVNQFGSTPFWAAPGVANLNPNPNTCLSVKKKLKLALEYLKKITRECDILIQAWMPVKRGGKCMLTTKSQAFSFSPNCKSLAYYRDVSLSFQFEAEEENTKKEEEGDIVSRVFLRKLPEWTPDVRFFREEEYMRVAYAQQLNISGSLVLPVFDRDHTSCLGVIEIVTTTQRVNYHPELESVSEALVAVDLRSSDVLGPPMAKAYDNGSYEATLAEIQQILKFVCDQHGLPLAQTWAPCIQQGKAGIRHSEENYSHCVSPIDSACYMPHPQAMGFHEACCEHHLLRGEGLVGEAFTTNQPCFSSDISAFSKTKEYPLSHHARMFGLCASIAVRLRSMHTGPAADFVLEFFLPFECQDIEQQRHMLSSLSSSILQVSHSVRVVTAQELLEETTTTTSIEREIITPPSSGTIGEKEENTRMFTCSHLSENSSTSEEEDSWITHMTNAQQESKPIILPMGYLQEEEEEEHEGEFKLTTHWVEDDGPQLYYVAGATTKDQTLIHESRGRKPVQKRQTKSEKSISLQLLRPYFAGSLKDAAKSIGVCPTTLKRICRRHGITRWPCRKIKKVEHSLRKLQNVIDSVQGVEDAFQLGSLYASLRSSNTTSGPNRPPPTPGINNLLSSTFNNNDQLKRQFTTQPPADNFSNNVTCQGHIDLPTVIQSPPSLLLKNSASQVQDGRLMKLKVSFGEERIRFSMQQHWQYNDLLNNIVKRFKIEEDCHSSRIEIKYLDDDDEWVLLECDADLEECLDVHYSCGSTMIKLTVHLGL